MDDDRLVKLTKQLVEYPSHHSQSITQIVNFLDRYLLEETDNKAEIDLISHLNDNGQSIPCLYAKNKEETPGKPTILLLGHLDVVPADTTQFIPRIEGNRLYGRGAGDMKAGVAVATKLFIEHYAESNLQLLMTTDEETGGKYGAGIISKILNPDFVITLEPSGLKICTKQKGALAIEIEAYGPGGHASRPWKSTSAVDMMIGVYNQLREVFPDQEKETWTNTMNVGAIAGGTVKAEKENILLGGANIIAAKASMKLDLRLTETMSHQEAIQIIKKTAADIEHKLRSRSDSFSLMNDCYKVLVNEPSVVADHLITSKDNTFIRQLVESYRFCLGEEAELYSGPSASDARFFSKRGIPAVVFGPSSVNQHGENEYVEIPSIIDTYHVLDTFLRTVKRD